MADKGNRTSKKKGSSHITALGVPVVIACVVVALVAGVLVGRFALGGSSAGAAFSGKTTVAEADLDKPLASFTYDGKTETVSVREAIESQVSLDSVKTDDGSYTMPSADEALSVARNRILQKVAADKGITVSDDELASYSEQMGYGSDFASIAQKYQLTEDQAKQVIRENAVMKKLMDGVVTTQAGTQPTPPDTPAEGTEDQANATYGAYIVGLLGDEWDSANNKWARTDGPYYAALSSETFSADSATYAQAQKAYYVAYQQYSTNSQSANSEWKTYVNGILSGASIELYTLGS